MGSYIDLDQMVNSTITSIVTIGIIWTIIQVAFWVMVVILISKYLAKQISKYFDYDRLAQRTAEEICKRMLLLEKQKTKGQEENKETEYTKAFEPGELSSNA